MPQHHEDNLQAAAVRWFRLQHPNRVIFAVPNGGRRNPREAARLRMQGVLAGVSDLCIAEPFNGFHGAFVEMKFGKNKTTDAQDKFMQQMRDRGYFTGVCYSVGDFIETIRAYFEEKKIEKGEA